MYAAIQIPDKVLGRMVPKNGLTLEDVIFSIGSEKVVRQLRDIEALVGKRDGKTLLFDAAEVAVVWREWFEGKYDQQIKRLG